MQKKSIAFHLLSLKKPAFLLLLLLGITTLTFAQVRTLTGTVSTSDSGETLPGATILVKGTATGTVTDLDGKYTLQVPQGPLTLVFSYIGYEAVEISVVDQAVVDAILTPLSISLDEVVVIGYGTIRKSDLTGSVASVKADDIVKITSSNPVQSLQGRVSGVQVTSTTGTPGASVLKISRRRKK